jgi:hypothetical protein
MNLAVEQYRELNTAELDLVSGASVGGGIALVGGGIVAIGTGAAIIVSTGGLGTPLSFAFISAGVAAIQLGGAVISGGNPPK